MTLLYFYHIYILFWMSQDALLEKLASIHSYNKFLLIMEDTGDKRDPLTDD